MGSFLTNVQVHTGGANRESIREAVVEALGKLVLEDGYRACSAGEAPDREIVIASAGRAPWISIYDQASEDQGGSHVELARSLSKSLTTCAISVLVHDSDVLEMKLFQDGRALDEHCNWPGYFEGRDREPQGDERAWKPVLRSGARPADLKKAWRAGAGRAEETLQEVASALAMNEELVAVGFNYLDDVKLPRKGKTRLAFCLRERPAHERKRVSQKSIGPPRLAPGMPGIPPPEEQVFGAAPFEPFIIPVLVHNQGGTGIGLEVTIAGPALEKGLVVVARVEVFAGRHQGDRVPNLSRAGSKRPVRAAFESIPLMAGSRDPLAINVQVHCASRPGAKEPLHLHISVSPLGAVERGCVQKFLVGKPR